MSECMLSIGLFDVHKKIFYICHLCRLKVLGMSMARGQAYGTTSATIILVKLPNSYFCFVYFFSITNMILFFMCMNIQRG